MLRGNPNEPLPRIIQWAVHRSPTSSHVEVGNVRYYNGSMAAICQELHWHLLEEGDPTFTGHWQSLKGTPHSHTRELFRVCVETPIPTSEHQAAYLCEPNSPWAEAHFQERVGGRPTNPGSQYMNWPWYDPNWKAQAGEYAKFSHTYQERMWPRHGVNVAPGYPADRKFPDAPIYHKKGLRYRYGDLQDVVDLLHREPTTRQAYLPIWFPEDTGAHHGERVPCTLGYHFMLRGGLLHVTYHIRSCDFLRYFRDDVYMAMRLGQWVLNELDVDLEEGQPDTVWSGVQMGILQMNIGSLHVFEGDMRKMRREAPAKP